MVKFAVVCVILSCLTCISCGEETEVVNNDRKDLNKFVPTNEWQTIPEGQGIPRGLHVRVDMQTGKKEAKILDESEKADSKNSALINTASEEEPSGQKSTGKEEEKQNDKLNHADLKEALKKIKNDGKEGPGDAGKFRSYEEIKEEMKKIEQSIATEYEIVKELVEKYLTLEEDSERKSILNHLEFYVHQYDNAQDFVKMGGFRDVVLPALNSSSTEVRGSAAFLLGSACQSNPKAQIAAIEVGTLPRLIRLVSFDPSHEVRNRAMYAISGIVRNFPLAQKALVQHGGISAFTKVFHTDAAHLFKLQLKIVTLLSDLILERDMAKRTYKDVLSEEPDDGQEHIETDTHGEKLRQYESAGVEKVLVEQGYCRLFPRLLTQLRSDTKQTRREDLSSIQGRALREEHDVVEKVLKAMLSMLNSCFKDFKAVGRVIQKLEERYEKLSRSERAAARSKSMSGDYSHNAEDMYYTDLYEMCHQIRSKILPHHMDHYHRDEL